MQDPSGGVPPGLLHHVHLQSSYSFPFTPQPLSLEQAIDALLRAPQTVRELASVAWTYLNQPPDGTVLLTWQPLNLLGTTLATDGYLWTAGENAYTQEIRGYTVEILVLESGFASVQDRVASHRRVRYRLVSNANNAPVDPALQIIHYMQALPEQRIPLGMFQPQQQQQQQMKERRFLESQGPLMRKEFMLNDRNNWPTVTMPGGQIPSNPYQQNFMYNRPGVPPFSRQSNGTTQPFPGQTQGIRHGSIGASPAKRATGTMAQMPGAGLPLMNAAYTNQLNEEVLENERNLEYGDMLDFLTPRDISAARYKQHHEWMEEILSSPYATSQIVPVDLNLRLAGSLSELTEALWGSNPIKTEKTDGGNDATLTSHDKIDPEKMAEFERRVSQYLQKGEEQMTSMKEAHAQQIDQVSRRDVFVNLERQLADLPEAGGSDGMERFLKEVENACNATVVPRENVKRVQDGGLLKGGEENANTQNPDEFPDFTNLDTAGEALDFYENMEYPT